MKADGIMRNSHVLSFGRAGSFISGSSARTEIPLMACTYRDRIV